MFLNPETNIASILLQSYREVPDKTAIFLLHSGKPPEAVSYRELLVKSLQYTQALRQARIQPGEVVILVLRHGIDLIAAFYGAILLGAIPSIMPFLTEKLQPEQYRASLTALFKITSPAAVITYEEFQSEAHKAALGTSVRHIFVKEEITVRNGKPQEEITFETEAPISGLKRHSDDIVLLQHSSGTTGLQKGVALSHKAVINQLNSYAKALNFTSEDVIISWLPLYHDMGLIAGFVLPVLMRIPLVLMSPFDWVRAPHKLLTAISQYKGTLCWLPNFAYNFCAQKIRERDLKAVDLSTLRALVNCSEPVHWNSHKLFYTRFKGYGLCSQALTTSYAMAENVFAVTQSGIHSPVMIDVIDAHDYLRKNIATPISKMVPQDEVLKQSSFPENTNTLRMVSCGRPITGTKLKVIDDQGKDLPERYIGEIALHSNYMLSEYFHRPDLTKEAFLDGWYLTGDLGYVANGEVFVTGRKKDLIIVGGKNVYPQDLERLASEVSGIHPGRVAAFGIYNEKMGTEEVVLVAETDLLEGSISQQEAQNALRDISLELRRRVTQGSDIALKQVYLVPRNWLIKTSSGKVARKANCEKYLGEITKGETDL